MSTLRVNTITNNGSAVDLPQKFKIGGSNVEQGYTASGSEPATLQQVTFGGIAVTKNCTDISVVSLKN